jgi:diguanylate cyclase (GGDEF)-like protein/PAS domain S-box-containing protein
MKALVAVDDPATRGLVTAALQDRLHRVFPADGRSVVDLCQKERPAFVLLSWRLSTSTAPPLVRQIRSLPRGDQTIVFALLDDERQDPAAALEAGADDYVMSPVDARLFEWRLALAERRSGELSRHRYVEQGLRQLYQAVLTMQIGVTISDRDGTIVFANPAVAAMHGYALEEVIGADARIFAAEPRPASRPVELGSVKRWSRERMSRRKEGALFPVRLMSDLVTDAAGAPIGIVTSSEDISERRRAEEALRDSEERYALAVAGANDGVWDWDLRKGVIHLSSRWKRIAGWDDADIGTSPDEWFSRVHPEDLPRLKGRLEAHLEGKSAQLEVEYRIRRRDGTWAWVLTRGVAVRAADGKPHRIAGSQTDVTDRRGFDALTLLPNRALLIERVELALARVRRRPESRFALLFLDLDRFKQVNDTLGHLAGDRLLVTTARRLEDCIRPGDTAARLGGDELAVLLDRIASPSDAFDVATRISRALSEPLEIQGRPVTVSASIGIAIGAGRGTASDLLGEADTALYHAKAAGRARAVLFDDAMRADARSRGRLAAELADALTRGALDARYEPLVRLADGGIAGLAAQPWWAHPTRGLLSPADFRDAAEEASLTLAVDDWLLDEACRFAAVLRSRQAPDGHPIVHVEVSARSLARPELADRVDEAVERSGAVHGALGLDVAEDVLLEPSETVARTLRRLKQSGVALTLCRFGTGVSGLTAPARFPIDALALAPEITAALPGEPSSLAVARGAAAQGATVRHANVARGR